MKKILMLSLGLGLAFSAQAETFFCGYRDYFHLSNNTPANVFVTFVQSDSNVYSMLVGPRGFELRDTPRCNSGYAQVSVAMDNAHYCILQIKDGPYLSTPLVSAACNDLTYRGMQYDGFNSYSYSLSFSL